jgi:hypothetical protein
MNRASQRATSISSSPTRDLRPPEADDVAEGSRRPRRDACSHLHENVGREPRDVHAQICPLLSEAAARIGVHVGRPGPARHKHI